MVIYLENALSKLPHIEIASLIQLLLPILLEICHDFPSSRPAEISGVLEQIVVHVHPEEFQLVLSQVFQEGKLAKFASVIM